MVFPWGDGKSWKIGYDRGGVGGGSGNQRAHRRRDPKSRSPLSCKWQENCRASRDRTAMERKDLNLKLPSESLDMRISEFKNDPDKMVQLNDFIDDVVEKAREEAELRQENNSKKKRLDSPFQNGSKKLGASISKAKTSAKTFASRVLTAICNCTNTVKSAVVNRH